MQPTGDKAKACGVGLHLCVVGCLLRLSLEHSDENRAIVQITICLTVRNVSLSQRSRLRDVDLVVEALSLLASFE